MWKNRVILARFSAKSGLFPLICGRFPVLQPSGCVLARSKKAPETAHFQAITQATFHVEHNKNTGARKKPFRAVIFTFTFQIFSCALP
jgi:hypothetical protein